LAGEGGFFEILKNPFKCLDINYRSELVSNMDEIDRKMRPLALYTESDFTPMNQNWEIMCTILSGWVS